MQRRVGHIRAWGTFVFCDLWEYEWLFILNVNQSNITSIAAHRSP